MESPCRPQSPQRSDSDHPAGHYLAMLLFTLITLPTACWSPPTEEPYVAVVGSRSGDSEAFGRQLELAVNYASKTDTRRRTTLRFRFLDDQGDSAVARRLALEIVADRNAVAVVGHSSSSLTEHAQAIYGAFEMPVIAPIATYSGLTRPTRPFLKPNAFRLVPSNVAQASLIGDLVRQEIARRAALPVADRAHHRRATLVYYEPTAYGADLGPLIESEIWNKGGDVRRRAKLTSNERGELQLDRARQDLREYSDIGIVVFAGYPRQSQELLRELAALDLDLLFLFTDGAKDPVLFERLGDVTFRAYLSFVAPDWAAATVTSDHQRADDLASLLEWLRTEGASTELVGFEPMAVDALYLLRGIATDTGTRWHTPSQLRRVMLEELRDTSKTHPGLFRDYRFTEVGEMRGAKAFLFHIVYNAGIGEFHRDSSMHQ